MLWIAFMVGVSALGVATAGGLHWYQKRPLPWDRFEAAMIDLGVSPVRAKTRGGEGLPRICRGTYDGRDAGFDEGSGAEPRIEVMTATTTFASNAGLPEDMNQRTWRPAPVFGVEANLDSPRFFATRTQNIAALEGSGTHPLKEGWLPAGLAEVPAPKGLLLFADAADPTLPLAIERVTAELGSLPADAAVYIDAPRVSVVVLRGTRTQHAAFGAGGMSTGVRDFETNPKPYLDAASAIAAALESRAYR